MYMVSLLNSFVFQGRAPRGRSVGAKALSSCMCRDVLFIRVMVVHVPAMLAAGPGWAIVVNR